LGYTPEGKRHVGTSKAPHESSTEETTKISLTIIVRRVELRKKRRRRRRTHLLLAVLGGSGRLLVLCSSSLSISAPPFVLQTRERAAPLFPSDYLFSLLLLRLSIASIEGILAVVS